jgi:hypothetical protein
MQDRTPDPDAWDRAAKAGEAAVRRAVGNAALRQIKRAAGPYADLGVALGALVATGDLIRGLTAGGNQRVTETMAAAYLLGALRGADQPLNPDGSPYTGAHLDA